MGCMVTGLKHIQALRICNSIWFCPMVCSIIIGFVVNDDGAQCFIQQLITTVS